MSHVISDEDYDYLLVQLDRLEKGVIRAEVVKFRLELAVGFLVALVIWLVLT